MSQDDVSREASGDGSRSVESGVIGARDLVSLRSEIQGELSRFRETLSRYDYRFTHLTEAFRNSTRRLYRVEQLTREQRLQQPDGVTPVDTALTSQLVNITGHLMSMQRDFVQLQLQSERVTSHGNDVMNLDNDTSSRLLRVEEAAQENRARLEREVEADRQRHDEMQQTTLRQSEKMADLQVNIT